MGSSPKKYNIVGNPNINRRDITRKITGSAVYTWDINPQHIGLAPTGKMVYMGVVSSPYPRARIKSIDVSAAKSAGYVAITGDDLPAFAYWGGGRTRLPLPRSSDLIMYPSQPVVAVAAPTPDGVEDAARLVRIEYEPLAWVSDQEEALAPGALQLYPGGNSPAGGFTNETGPVPSTITIKIGNADSALSSAEIRVGDQDRLVYNTQLEQHYEFEPYAAVAQWANGNLRIWSSTEFATAEQGALAAYFGIPLNNVVLSTGLGGGAPEGGGVLGMALGNKIAREALVVAAFIAKTTGNTVKVALPRGDHTNWSSHRFPMRAYVTLGGKKDGTITAMKAVIYTSTGANGGSAGSDAVSDMYHMYNIPNVDIVAYSANTNTYDASGAMRDVGETQGHFFIESAVDEFAQALNMDPVALRLKNLRGVDPGTGNPPVDPTTNFPYTSSSQPEAFNKGVAGFGWSAKWKGWGVASQANGPIRRGVGVANMNGAKGAVSAPSTGQIQVSPDGTVQAFTGLTDHGAGGNTTFAILAAEALGLTSLDKVTLIQSDTSLTTNSGVTAGSRSTRVCGMAFIAAAKDLMRQWGPIVVKNLAPNTDPKNLAFGNNTIYDSTNPSNSISFSDAAALLGAPLKGMGSYVPPGKIAQRVQGTKFAEVEVNTETGDVRVVKFTSSIGIGRVIFAKGAESQVRGGFFMGMGNALWQERWIDPTTGMTMNPNFHDFKIPTIMETPEQIDALWVEQDDPYGPFGAVGLGELALMTVSPAIANALSNALGGYRFRSIPISREKIIEGVHWAKGNGKL